MNSGGLCVCTPFASPVCWSIKSTAVLSELRRSYDMSVLLIFPLGQANYVIDQQSPHRLRELEDVSCDHRERRRCSKSVSRLLRKAFSTALFTIFRSPPERIVEERLLDVLQGTLKKDEKLGILSNWTSGEFSRTI